MVQTSALTYDLVDGWEQLPPGYAHRDVAGVACDSQERVFLICRGDHPIMIYDREGRFIKSWGEGLFSYRTHGLTIVDDFVYATDDGQHTVRKFTLDGELLMTLGVPNQPSDTGYDGSNLDTVTRPAGLFSATDDRLSPRGSNLDTVTRPAGPFNRPTNLAIGPNGDLYISDGYGNCRTHRFSPRGELKQSWGTPGTEPGQFNLPHGIAASADGRIFVCDRENDRIQIFSPEGEYLDMWTDVQRPTHIVFDQDGRAYVSELWWHVGQRSYTHGKAETAKYGRCSVYTPDGKLLARWGSANGCAPGSFSAPHGIAVDSRSSIYVAEVTWTFTVSRGHGPEDCHTFQKFARRA